MLTLAFPEVHWIFWMTQPEEQVLWDEPFFRYAHVWCYRPDGKGASGVSGCLASLKDSLHFHDCGYRPLFDPTGFRNDIFQRTKKELEEQHHDADYLPNRQNVAAAIDEEAPYAYMNAYIAYRFGYRSHMVTTNAYTEKLFKKAKDADDQDERSPLNAVSVELTFEDLFLNFPDRGAEHHYSNLQERDKAFEKLKQAERRIFVTVGHHHTLPKGQRSANKKYLRDWKNGADGRRYKFIYKPVSGIYNLARDALLRRPEGFVWPPPRPRRSDVQGAQPAPTPHHSAPGRLLVIAERLIRRAEQILPSPTSAEDSIYGALLALEAQQILGNRTPTTALEAFAIRQQLEVIAECMFYGVEAHLNVKDRFQEIEKEVHSIGDWFNPETRKAAELNAQAGILNKLISRFREHNQFDEEQECLNKARQLERRLGLYDANAWARIRAWVAFPFRWYVESLLGSIRWFILALVGWVAVFALAYYHCCDCLKPTSEQSTPTIIHGFADAVSSFVGLQPPHDLNTLLENDWMPWLSMVAIILGFVHLGIFISHVYSMIARR